MTAVHVECEASEVALDLQKANGLYEAAERLMKIGRFRSALAMLQYGGMRPAALKMLTEIYRKSMDARDPEFAQGARDLINAHCPEEERKALYQRVGGFLAPEVDSGLLAEAGSVPSGPRTRGARNRVLYVLHNSRPYATGGYATRGHGLASGLRAQGIDLLCLSRPGFPADTDPALEGTEIPALDLIDAVPYHRSETPVFRRGWNSKEYSVAASQVLEERIREFDVDCVLAASAYVSALPALVAARRTGRPFIYEVRGLWEVARYSAKPVMKTSPIVIAETFLETHIAKNADAILTLTGGMRDELIKRGVAPEKITLVPNSCDPSKFVPRARDAALGRELGIPDGVPVIGYIGTFVQYEGLDDLTRACGILRRRGVDFRLLLVGSENTLTNNHGPIRKAIERIAAEEGITDKVILAGRVPHEQVHGLYSLIDVAPFPRKPQPVTEMVSPMKPLEALSMEKAVLVSSVQALAEMVVPNETGLVFAKGDLSSLADGLERLIRDADLRQTLGRNARDWVERNRTWERTASTAKMVLDGFLD